MDHLPGNDRSRDDSITLSPDMRPPSVAPGPTPFIRPRRSSSAPLVVAALAAIVGLAALGASVWFYAEMRKDILRLSTDMAQLRVSLDLYARNGGSSSADGGALADLGNRLAILEQNWRGNAVPVPEAAPSVQNDTTAAQGEDCLPVGMRLLVAAGDKYAICGQDAEVEVGIVDNGYIALSDGSVIPSGGMLPLPGTSCNVGVTSGGDEGLTGYAEIRVNC
ncbi:MAG: hypothetical protein ABS75_09700 [Pelagibacterium sp. SCN 63-23]|nr:MAG: hypothetical protein ABS75_09700 [Pelagibacterium sp. SCN 63-23]